MRHNGIVRWLFTMAWQSALGSPSLSFETFQARGLWW